VEGDQAAEAGVAVEAGVAMEAGPLLLREAGRSLRLEASSQSASPRLFPPFGRPIWRGSSMACVSTTSISANRLTTVSPPATGETSLPGASRRRSSRPAGPHYGPALAKAFPGGYRSCLFGFSAFLDQLPKRPSLGWCTWAANFLLGRQDFSPLFRRSEVQLAFSAGCSSFPLLEWIFCVTSGCLRIRPLTSWSTATAAQISEQHGGPLLACSGLYPLPPSTSAG
jgi:hypothetical protein